jgi:hypothetical protein
MLLSNGLFIVLCYVQFIVLLSCYVTVMLSYHSRDIML